MEIAEFNPWWETGSIEKEIKSLRRRFLFETLKEYLSRKQVDVIIGLRRVGKTVLMQHLIDHLLTSGTNPKEIFYFSFDIEKEDLDKIIKEYEEKILKDRIKNKKIYFIT
ncbi:MAG: AAA family ATPase [Candidatus Desulfofervidus auxilii]|nr:AAA family ATPase [Candidatus Desulfofervidus auxilii]